MSNKKNIFQFIALGLFFVVFPLMSWYYLQEGFDYRLEALAELRDLGALPELGTEAIGGTIIDRSFLRGNVVVTNVHQNSDDQEKIIERLKALNKQFKDRSDVFFLSMPIGDARTFTNLATKYDISPESKWYLLDGENGSFVNDLTKQLSVVPDSIKTINGPLPTNYVVLADTSLSIRRYYDPLENADMRRLVEHIAMIMPFKNDREIIFEREKEK